MRIRALGRVALTLVVSAGPSWAEQNASAPVPAGNAQGVSAAIAIPDIVTDRPDFTESSEVVSRGFIQFEAGFSYEASHTRGERSRSITVPASLLRVGLGHRTELRLSADGFISERTNGVAADGFADLEVGAKVRLLDASRVGVDVAVIPMMSLPTGARGFTAGAVDPTVKLTWARDLPGHLGLTGNFNLSSVSQEPGRFIQRAISVSLGRDVGAGWGGYIEGYAFTPMGRGEGTGATLDFGVSRPIGWRAQIDFEAGHRLTNAAPDWFVGMGVALRGRVGRRSHRGS